MSLSVVLLLTAACASVGEKVSSYVREGKLDKAKVLLQEEGLWDDLPEEADEEVLVARSGFEEAVVAKYTMSADAALEEGRARAALAYAVEGLELCPW